MLRDSCLYSSLACSVYSIRWVFSFFFFFFLLVLNNMQIFIHHFHTNDNSRSVICSADNTFVHFWIHEGRLSESVGEFMEKCSKQSNVVFGRLAIARESLNVTLLRVVVLLRSSHSSIMLMLLWPLQGCAFRYMAESAVSTVVFPDGVRYCMETWIFIVYLWFSRLFWLTNHML